MGNRLPKLSTQAELRRRAEALVRLKHSATISPQALEAAVQRAAEAPPSADFSIFFRGNAQYAASLPSKVEPAGRSDAAMLGAALGELLPEGAVTAKYRVAVADASEAQALYANSLDLRSDFELVDVTLRECARQVAGQCVERAQVIETVRSEGLQGLGMQELAGR